jgi:uncharacterized lipoprotein YmbA
MPRLARAAPWLLAGCSILRPQPDRTRTFVLRPLAASERQPVRGFAPVIGIGPILVPDHLDQGLVTRVGRDEISVSDTDRWAEPLHDHLSRALGQDLSVLLGTERILTYPWDLATPPDVAVTVEVLAFERTTQNTVTLTARWILERGSDRTPLHAGETHALKRMDGTDTPAAVAALSVALGQLSQEIATAIGRRASVYNPPESR